jgi:manganese-dependent ADP-ribose/CDP-alcohol diphosphatase
MAQAAAAATCAAVSPSVSPTPLFRFGLLSDVQHADKDDGVSFHGTPRYYRCAPECEVEAAAAVACVPPLPSRLPPLPTSCMLACRRRYALQQLDRAVAAFQAADCSFCIHLGDLCDGHNSQMGECAATRLTHSEKALRSALAHFERFGKPTLHLLGVSNHGSHECSAAKLLMQTLPCGRQARSERRAVCTLRGNAAVFSAAAVGC